jgi:hypothetical protein
MKKTLLGTTALVAGGLLAAPAMAADPIKLELRGYYQFMIVVGHTDRDIQAGTIGTSYRPENFKYEGEIWFTGTTKLDNGSSIGVRIELEGWSQSAAASASLDQMDEEYMFAFGDWGRIEFGGTDSASFKMQYSSPSALIGWGFNDHNFNYFGAGFAAAMAVTSLAPALRTMPASAATLPSSPTSRRGLPASRSASAIRQALQGQPRSERARRAAAAATSTTARATPTATTMASTSPRTI